MKIDTLTYLIIPEKEAKEWYKSYLYMRALENGGVDNWEWYSESINNFIKECWDLNHPNDERKAYETEHGAYRLSTIVDEDLTAFNRLEFQV